MLCTPLLLVGCNSSASNEASQSAPVIEPPSPENSPSATGGGSTVSQDLVLSGTAAAIRTSMLASKGSGILRSIKVREGERVKAGQVLCVLDTVTISLHAEAAAADQAQALAALEDAKRDMARVEQLADAGALPEQTAEKAELGLKIASLRARAAGVGVRMAHQALSDATLRAPFDGVITKVLSEEGQYVAMMPPTPVFLLVDTDTLEVRVPVPERKVASVSIGQPVVVELPAVNVTRSAKVDRKADVVDPMTRSTEVVIRLDNSDRSLPAGLFATVTFTGVPAGDSGPSEVPRAVDTSNTSSTPTVPSGSGSNEGAR